MIITMACHVPGCLGNYNFANLALFARKRFIEGCNTIDLMRNARTHREKEEIALVAMLDLNNKTVIDLRLDCKHAGTCQFTNCRNRLKKMIEEGLVQKNNSLIFQF
jgi:hypothetical protein